MRRLAIILGALLLAASAAAQTITTVTDTVRDIAGNIVPSGQVTFVLQPPGPSTISGIGTFSSQTISCTINQAQGGIGTGQVSSLVRSSNVVTATFVTTQPFIVGDVLTLASWSDTTFNGTFTVTSVTTGASPTAVWSQTASNSSATGGYISALRSTPGPGPCTLTQNTALTPAGTYYKVTIWPNFAATASFNYYALTATVDLSSVVPTPGQVPAFSFVDLFSNQTISGNKTFTGSTTWSGTQTFNSAVNLTNGGSLAGTFSGSPTLSGNPTFSGTPVLNAGASLSGTLSGSPTFSGTPNFKAGPTYDVTAYGAKCDGVTDDTTALQAAATAITNGGVLHIPATGNLCGIKTPITLTASTDIQCDGWGSGLKLLTGATGAIKPTSVSQITVNDCKIDATNVTGVNAPLLFTSINQLYFIHNWVIMPAATTNASTEVDFESDTNVVVEDNLIQGCPVAGGSDLQGANNTNILERNNIVDGLSCTQPTGELNIMGGTASGTIMGNVFKNFTGSNSVDVGGSNHVSLVGNTGMNVSGGLHAEASSSNSSDISMMGNAFFCPASTTTGQGGFSAVQASTFTLKDVTISGNVAINCLYGVQLEGVNGFVVNDNELESSTDDGIHMQRGISGSVTETQNGSVNGNTVLNSSQAGSGLFNGIVLLNSGHDISINYNRIDSTLQSTGINLGSGTSNIAYFGNIVPHFSSTAYSDGGLTQSKFNILSSLTVGAPVSGLSLMSFEAGSANGTNYTNATTSLAAVDTTNLQVTLNIPTNHLLFITASCPAFNTTATDGVILAIRDTTAGATLNSATYVSTAASQQGVITVAAQQAGSAVNHVYQLQFAATVGGTATLVNSATSSCTMQYSMN